MLSDQSAEALLTLTADGAVGADFAGHISAAGIDLDSAPAPYVSPPPNHAIIWDKPDGVNTAEIWSQDNHETFIRTQGDGISTSLLELVSSIGSGGGAALSLVSTPGGSRFLRASTQGGIFADILDQLGRSSFLQLAEGVAARKISFGSFALNFPGSTYSDQIAVNHNLGKTPSVVLALVTGLITTANHICAVGTDNYTPTQFTVRAKTANGAAIGPGTLTCYFVAIG